MKNMFHLAVVGLDTSHAVEFPKLMQDPAVPEPERIAGLKVSRCLRFETPFQNKAGLDKRQAYLESIGVKVTEDFSETVADCDGIMIEINDPALHLEYFEKCAPLGKPIFLDKPFADTFANSLKIDELAKKHSIRYFTASALRFNAELEEALVGTSRVTTATVSGAMGKAAAGSSLVWYGCHSFDMLERIMGRGAVMVSTVTDRKGHVCVVTYADGRRGIVELSTDVWIYGGKFVDAATGTMKNFTYSGKIPFYRSLLDNIRGFFLEGKEGVAIPDCLEVISLLDAADRSARSGKPEAVYSA
ncbi:MAG: Oxidoreductase family, NAD-binding Rossmann fold [Lentisphaerae bacterium ADurb.Bin242]|nr:MAG: Oxidoreductase family, NAD-binding Rossmann fold [Lentisphaerae bacterium ADurb.Bin242]